MEEDVLQAMGLQRVGHDWVTELNWTEVSEEGGMTQWSTENFLGSENTLYDTVVVDTLEVCLKL